MHPGGKIEGFVYHNYSPMENQTSTPQDTVNLKGIADTFGLQLNAAFLSGIGFEPVAKNKASLLYRKQDVPSIGRALISHVEKQLSALQ